MNYNRTLDIYIITKKLQLQYKEYYLYNEYDLIQKQYKIDPILIPTKNS